MLAQLFNPTEIKKNGPATRPATAPARRSDLPFRAALAVLPATSQSYGAARVIVNDHPGGYGAVAPRLGTDRRCGSASDCEHAGGMRSRDCSMGLMGRVHRAASDARDRRIAAASYAAEARLPWRAPGLGGRPLSLSIAAAALFQPWSSNLP